MDTSLLRYLTNAPRYRTDIAPISVRYGSNEVFMPHADAFRSSLRRLRVAAERFARSSAAWRRLSRASSTVIVLGMGLANLHNHKLVSNRRDPSPLSGAVSALMPAAALLCLHRENGIVFLEVPSRKHAERHVLARMSAAKPCTGWACPLARTGSRTHAPG